MEIYDIFDFPLFEGCNRPLLQALLDSTDSRLNQYVPGHLLALQDSPCRSLLLLCSGSLTACMTNAEGKEFKIETLKAPEVLAPAFVYGSENRFPVTLKAEPPVPCGAFRASAFWTLWNKTPPCCAIFCASFPTAVCF